MTTVFKAHFDGDVIVPDEPVHIETGRELIVQVTTPAPANTYDFRL